MEAKKNIIVALDFPGFTSHVDNLVHKLRDEAGIENFKAGLQMMMAEGVPKISFIMRDLGVLAFLDTKLHDIPNTVGEASREIVKHNGANMFNLHVTGGPEMMLAAVEATTKQAEMSGVLRPLVLGVTILTSIDILDLKNIGFQVSLPYGVPAGREAEAEALKEKEMSRIVVHLAKMAQDCGLDGVVCSGKEIEVIREACGPDLKLVVPGIRFADSDAADQKRIVTPKIAIERNGSRKNIYLVIGRPITAAKDPVAATIRANDEIESAKVEEI